MTRTRRIGPIGTTTRLIAAAALLYLALFNGTSWGLHWYDALLGLVLLPGLMLTIPLVARHRGTGPIRFTGATGTMFNLSLIHISEPTRRTPCGRPRRRPPEAPGPPRPRRLRLRPP